MQNLNSKPCFILNIVYGYIGVWGDKIVNFSSSEYLSFEHSSDNSNFTTAYWIQEHREKLINVLHQRVVSNLKEKQTKNIEEIIPMFHVISESIISTYSY